MRTNQEFADLEEFAANVRKYDPYRSMEHIERTVKYNMLRRADGRFVSKCDSTPRRIGMVPSHATGDQVTLEDAKGLAMPVLVIRGANSNILTAEAADRFRAALPRGELITVADCGHNVHSQNTAGFLQALGSFLKSL